MRMTEQRHWGSENVKWVVNKIAILLTKSREFRAPSQHFLFLLLLLLVVVVVQLISTIHLSQKELKRLILEQSGT